MGKKGERYRRKTENNRNIYCIAKGGKKKMREGNEKYKML